MNRASVVTALCVIIIVLGLFTVAIRKMRRVHAETMCTNNLKQLGIGVANYHDVYRRFPLAIVKYEFGPGSKERSVDLPVEQSASWLCEIDPFVHARMNERFRVDINKPWDAAENRHVGDSPYPVLQCDQALRDGIVDTTQSSYIAILGLGRDAGWGTKDDAGRGVFGFRHHVTRGDIKDGTANTMAIAETTRDNGRWIAGGYPTARGVDPDGPPYLGRIGQFGSLHSGVSVVGMTDGSVRRLNADTSPSVLEALATIAGGEPVD
jgi:hypothetical protein